MNGLIGELDQLSIPQELRSAFVRLIEMYDRTGSVKTWDYEEITEATEQKLRSLATTAANAKTNNERQAALSMAGGQWLLWWGLTAGWQKDGDSDRLRAIFEGKSD